MELGMQQSSSLAGRKPQYQGRPVPSHGTHGLKAKAAFGQRRRRPHLLLPVASQGSGLTSSVQLGPSFDEQPTNSSQNGAAEGIETVELASEVPCLSHFPPCTQQFALHVQANQPA